MSKNACDFSGVYGAQGVTANIYMSFGTATYGSVPMLPGDVWYINIKDELPFGGNSCGS